VLELAEGRLLRLQDQLVRCGPGEFQSLQGEARAFMKLLEDIRIKGKPQETNDAR